MDNTGRTCGSCLYRSRSGMEEPCFECKCLGGQQDNWVMSGRLLPPVPPLENPYHQIEGLEALKPEKALATQVGGGHYKDFKIQPVEFIVANDISYREANVIKYVCRHRSKNGKQDVQKAIHYLQMILDEYEEAGEE